MKKNLKYKVIRDCIPVVKDGNIYFYDKISGDLIKVNGVKSGPKVNNRKLN